MHIDCQTRKTLHYLVQSRSLASGPWEAWFDGRLSTSPVVPVGDGFKNTKPSISAFIHRSMGSDGGCLTPSTTPDRTAWKPLRSGCANLQKVTVSQEYLAHERLD